MYKRQLKDPDFGIYPMVTSSSTLAGYGAVGAGLPPHSIEDIVVVTKAYSSAAVSYTHLDVYKRQVLYMQVITAHKM